LTEQEVLAHLDGKLGLPPSRQYLAREISNILAGCNWIRELIPDLAAGQVALDPTLVKKLNGMVLEGLTLEENAAPGEVRKHEKLVFRYRPAPAEDCEFLLDRLCDWINRKTFSPPAGMTIVYALIKAVVTHLYLAWIHPFGDGNGRTARLLEHLVLLQAGVPAPAAQLLSRHYHLTRSEYFRQLDQASRSGGEVEPFLVYAVQGFRDGLCALRDEIRERQAEALWQAHVHETFRGQGGPGALRQLRLALELAAAGRPVPPAELPALSPQLAQTYAGKSAKTLARDAQALIALGLAEKTAAGFRARREIVSAFLSVQRSLL
jgi:Fic family protein